ncbi:MAG: rhamnulokinase, partial [Armatimonadetes bacterium]|nr:rhamnulokinase [Armatimonadota bacterium]
LGVDTWGVDFALLDKADDVLGLPYHYRDSRTDGVMDEVFRIVPRDEVYRTTGIQFMQLNTLFQLMAMRLAGSPLLDLASSLLMTPDLINFWLTGVKANEFTNATTTQCYDPRAAAWATGMLERLGIPTGFLGEIVPPGTVLGPLHPSVRDDTGAGQVRVIAPATHDTGSAVVAVPAEGADGWAYISCGTWSLVGVEASHPVINERTLACNLTNEGGVCGTFRLLRNVMGLWLLQQCRQSWARSGSSYAYDELARMAAEAPAFAALIDPDDPAFLKPRDMPEAIAEYCRKTGQVAPASVASYVRTIVEGLALKYRWVLERLEEVTGKPIETVHIIGGGSQNRLLCQATADGSGKRVVAGPIEATALGNVTVQAMATGVLTDLKEARAAIARSFPLVEYLPQASDVWHDPYRRFMGLLTV